MARLSLRHSLFLSAKALVSSALAARERCRQYEVKIHSHETTQPAKNFYKNFVRQVLGVGAMVTYLRLCLHSVKELVELVDLVMCPLSEHPHNLAGILLNIGDCRVAGRLHKRKSKFSTATTKELL